jgi:hypothetical protein
VKRRLRSLSTQIAARRLLLVARLDTWEGLRPSAHGVRLRFSGGKRTIVKGPFARSNELIDRYLIVQVKSIDEAILWAERFARLIGDVEIDVRMMREPSELN